MVFTAHSSGAAGPGHLPQGGKTMEALRQEVHSFPLESLGPMARARETQRRKDTEKISVPLSLSPSLPARFFNPSLAFSCTLFSLSLSLSRARSLTS